MRRPEKVAELVREEIAQIVGYELEDPRVAGVTVTDVRMSDNLRDARVYVTVAGTDAEAAAALRALELNLKRAPEIHFVRDTVEEKATRVDALLHELEREHAPAESAERGESE